MRILVTVGISNSSSVSKNSLYALRISSYIGAISLNLLKIMLEKSPTVSPSLPLPFRVSTLSACPPVPMICHKNSWAATWTELILPYNFSIFNYVEFPFLAHITHPPSFQLYHL
ncbi:113aa long hypothetical protein [Pyrococcus horikoshii OT3]|uniref:Uncharacterized protein n=1 Tax=Pyrococcus horikoshii (strain ATCC 700860 / DSM 12428 / JCM 9974 / NBRC 100139 / OT-3) TaxID=70601 RepID=O59573_PYRHO|nr:113aa long hypothetical protein [Pyrococcus horikoshii OT3]